MRRFRYPLLAIVILMAAILACGQGSREESELRAELPTLRPTFTAIVPTETPVPPTNTVPPTVTPFPPTDTPPPPPTETPPPTDTPVPPTDTPVPPTETPRPTKTPGPPTHTPIPPTAAPPSVLLESDFDDGFDSAWTPFLNYWRLKDGQWYWGAEDGVNGSGAMAHHCCLGDTHADDGLMMYLGEGAEDWTDYRVEVQLKTPATRNRKQGIWVRGQYEPSETRAQWVTGYYVLLEGTRRVSLLQMQTSDDCVAEGCDNPASQYAFFDPYELRFERVPDWELTRTEWHTLTVEVKGNRIGIWVDGKFAFEYVDDHYPFLKGTVGFNTFGARPVFYDNIKVTPLD
jgi:hypothetical protein